MKQTKNSCRQTLIVESIQGQDDLKVLRECYWGKYKIKFPQVTFAKALVISIVKLSSDD